MGPDNRPVSPTEYVRNALSQQPGDVDKKNRYLSLHLLPPSLSLSLPLLPILFSTPFLLFLLKARQKLLQRVEKKTMGGVPLVAHNLPVESGLNGSGVHLDSLVPHQLDCKV
jgi:hypothetical protein